MKSRTFQRKLILYNMIIIVCIASAISFYNYNSYRNDVLASETRNSLNRITSVSDRMQVAYDEMVNIVLNCSDRPSLFLTTKFSAYKEGYENPAAAVYAANVLKDLCAISGYSRYIYKITLYNNGFILQAGSSFGYGDDPKRIMATSWFRENLAKAVPQYQLSLVDNPFSTGVAATPKILPLLRPLQHVIGASEDHWIFLGISPLLFKLGLESMPNQSIAYAVTAEGDIIASQHGDEFQTDQLISQLLLSDDNEGTFRTKISYKDCIVTYTKQPISGVLFF